MSILDLPPMADNATPVILPGLLSGLGITRRQVPSWITDPDTRESIAIGEYEIDDDLAVRDTPTLAQIKKKITGRLCFYVLVYQARIAELEQRISAAEDD
ncbi:hypothetical protein ACFWPQ_02095 [Streptomyces sp. NPDC058464]|uniref:hypothetical protein n=1 Tax=Streptomyces sp. NPDC058464 TaxID=3346511 RepID=UPI0036489D66